MPSEALIRADSFDIMVLDVANTFEEYKRSQKTGDALPKDLVDNDELANKLKRARGEI